MPAEVFLDSNVLVYAFDVSDRVRHERACALLGAPDADRYAVSTQVLQEFFWISTRKLRPPLAPREAAVHLTEFARLHVVAVDVPLVLRSASRTLEDSISFWDALIVESALAAGCTRLLTEDLQHGRTYGPLRVENPFR